MVFDLHKQKRLAVTKHHWLYAIQTCMYVYLFARILIHLIMENIFFESSKDIKWLLQLGNFNCFIGLFSTSPTLDA